MHAMTRENLQAALAGESQAHIKYLAFAAEAKKAGKPNIARLFEAIAYAEQVHATNHLKQLGGVGDTVANLETAIAGETFEVEEMYAAYLAKEAAQAGKDIEIDKVYICPVCGYTHIGEPPDRCPVCKVGKDQFKAF